MFHRSDCETAVCPTLTTCSSSERFHYDHYKCKSICSLKKKVDLTTQTRTMACLTAVQNWTWCWFPRCFWKRVPQSMLQTQPSHSPLVPPLAPASNVHTAPYSCCVTVPPRQSLCQFPPGPLRCISAPSQLRQSSTDFYFWQMPEHDAVIQLNLAQSRQEVKCRNNKQHPVTFQNKKLRGDISIYL